MRYITAVIIATIGTCLVVFYAMPKYDEISKLQKRVVELQEYVDKATKAQAKIDELQMRYKSFPEGASDKMKTMLPDNVDDVRLSMDVTDLAALHGISLANPSIRKVAGDKNSTVQEHIVSISIDTPYNTFRRFLGDMEYWLQIRDITNLSVSTGEKPDSPMSIKMEFITYSAQ